VTIEAAKMKEVRMHERTLQNLRHDHDFSLKNERGERRTMYVLILTAITMVVEIVAGTVFGSMALLADGWHMATHVAAFLITIYAYRYARQHAKNTAYSFGTGKVSVLGGFASAVALTVVAFVMLAESLHRLIDPQIIQFNAAIGVAVIGLGINVISAFLLKDDHHHLHYHAHLKAAYFHVLADALTSLLAIVALLAGKYFGWHWLDPVMGIVGAVIITRWSYGLVKQTGPILLDGSIDEEYKLSIKDCIEKDSDNRVSDIHIWKISSSHYAAIISLVTDNPRPTAYYKKLLLDYHKLAHITVEVNECDDESCAIS
jgi:cation diffusion facilitator family transporter